MGSRIIIDYIVLKANNKWLFAYQLMKFVAMTTDSNW